MRLRVRSPFGVVNLNLSSDEPTLNDFLSEMKNAQSVVVDDDDGEEKKKKKRVVVESFRFGFPKSNSFVLKDFADSGEATLSATFGIRDGETITVKFAEEEEEEEEEDDEDREAKRKRERDEEEEEEKAGDVHEKETVTKGRERGGSGDVAGATGRTTPTIQNNSIETNNTNGMTEEEEALARAVEASMLDERRGDGAVAGASAGYDRDDEDHDDDGTIAVRKVIDADNSCLFNAIGYVFFRSLEKAKELRKVVHDAVLSDATLENADCEGADFRGADLSGANLTGANLTGALLNLAYLSEANLTGADLTNANLGQCNLTGTIFKDANLSGAIVSGANMDDLGDIDGSDWTDVIVRKDVNDKMCARNPQGINAVTGNPTAMSLFCN